MKKCKKNGARVRLEEVIAVLTGSAKQLAAGKEQLIGWISKSLRYCHCRPEGKKGCRERT